jgi:hypothetical protein
MFVLPGIAMLLGVAQALAPNYADPEDLVQDTA